MKSIFFRLAVYLQRYPTWLLLPIYFVWFATYYVLHVLILKEIIFGFEGKSIV